MIAKKVINTRMASANCVRVGDLVSNVTRGTTGNTDITASSVLTMVNLLHIGGYFRSNVLIDQNQFDML